jgi:hypothetical protein
MKIPKIFAAGLVAALAAAFLFAIETGEIRGRILDEDGAGLPGVEVTAAGPNLQGKRVTLTSEKGAFDFPLLPVGTYSLSIRIEGFDPAVQDNIIVRLGQVTSVLIVLKPSEIRNEVTVTAQAPLLDKTSSDTSFNLTSEDLARLPAQNRTVVDAVKFAPGAAGVRMNTRTGIATEGQPSFRGEGQEGNTWIVDGLAVSGIRLRDSGVPLNVDAIDEIQIISDPFNPEFGSAYGGVINMVTKRGGNDWSGEFSLLFKNKNLQAAKKDQLSVVSDPSYFSNANWFANLGGPLVKDKLWFFLSGNLYSDTSETEDAVFDYLAVPAGKKTTRLGNFFAKLSGALGPRHTLSLTTIVRDSLGQKGGTGIPELYEEKIFTDTMARLNYKGILNSTTFIEAGAGGIRRKLFTTPLDGDLGPAMYTIEDLGRSINNSYGDVTDDEERLDFSLKLSKHVDSRDFGKHDLSLGLEYYRMSSDFRVDFTGQDEDFLPGDGFDAGTKYYFDTWRDGRGTPTVYYEYGPFNFLNSASGIGVFFRDRLTLGRMTVMIGLRSQTQRCLDDAKGELWSWGIGDFLSPRLTLTYDLGGDGKSILRLGWGRFSDLISTMPLGLFNSGAGLTFRTYRWAGPDEPSEAERLDPANWTFQNEQALQAFEVDPGIKPNFLTRYLAEFGRQLGPDWAAKVRLVHTNAKNLLEVLAVLDPETLYRFLYDNFELKRRDYTGVELEINGSLGSRLFLNASYAYGLARGTNPGQTETGSWSQEEGSTNFLGLFGNHLYVPDTPEYEDEKAWVDWQLGGLGGRGIGDEGWYGRLPYSVTHDVKINLAWSAPWGITGSAAFEWLSGYPWEKLGYVPFFGGYYSYPEGRGTNTTPAHAFLDLSFEKAFALGSLPLLGEAGLRIRADMFNLLNSQRPVSYVKEDIPVFGSVWGRQQPRQARVMLSFGF